MLLFLDVDGTLVGSSGVLSDEVCEAADTLREFGVRLAVCTGRPCAGVAHEIASRLDASAPHIFLDGALVRTAHGRIIDQQPIDEDVLRPLIDASREWNATLELYSPTDDYADEITPACREHADAIGVEPIERDLDDVAAEEDILKAQWIVDESKVDDIMDLDVPGCHSKAATSPVVPDKVFINVTRSDISKGEAGETAAAHLGAELSDAVAVGDSESDRAILSRVGHPFVMANATESLRTAYETVGHVDDDGVLQVFEYAAQLIYRQG